MWYTTIAMKLTEQRSVSYRWRISTLPVTDQIVQKARIEPTDFTDCTDAAIEKNL